MRRFTPDEIERFLRAADAEIAEPTRVYVGGGTAVWLHGAERHATTDIDLLEANPSAESAFERARQVTGLRVPVGMALLPSLPRDYEDRRHRAGIEGLEKLEIFVPERHDLAILKIVRGESHDFEALEELHAVEPFDLDTLVSRYRETIHIGNQGEFRWSFVAAVERLFGADAASGVEEQLG